MKLKEINFEEITIESNISHRGGYVVIDLGKIYKKYKGHRMVVYQNYLGGGLLGRILGDCTLKGSNDTKLAEIMLLLKKYMHSLTNPDTEWESRTYEEVQRMPVSGY